MQIKEIKPINFLFFRTETKVSELSQFLPVGQQLFAEALKNKLFISGPVHWHYYGFNGDQSQPFTLEISIPVSDVVDEYDGPFHFKRTDSFRCVSMVHEGSWFEAPVSYNKLMEFIKQQNLQTIAANREIYVNVDFNDPSANTTEIQIGIR
jgi:effector-binding domain-containing protein